MQEEKKELSSTTVIVGRDEHVAGSKVQGTRHRRFGSESNEDRRRRGHDGGGIFVVAVRSHSHSHRLFVTECFFADDQHNGDDDDDNSSSGTTAAVVAAILLETFRAASFVVNRRV